MEQMTSICDMVGQYMQKKEEEKRIAKEQAAKTRYWKIPICYDDDDDEESSIPLKDIIISGLPPCVAVTPVLSTKEPVNSLIMEDEHLEIIPATESDEVIKSSVWRTLFQIPKNSSGSTTTRSDYSLPDYEAFYFDDDHIEEKSSGSTTTQSELFHKGSTVLLELASHHFTSEIAQIFEASRARGFILRSLELHILSFILGIQYPNLID
ncbi:hypothetical protein Tco_0186146 [Tanacetum coccineum]